MWRFCDLHNHTPPNESCESGWYPDAFVESCIDAELDVVAVTDHDHIQHVKDAVAAASSTTLVVIPGVELSTDRGHVILLSAAHDGLDVLHDFIGRTGASPGVELRFDDITLRLTESRSNGQTFASQIISIGAHVDQPASLLASSNQMGIAGQLALATKMNALEVSKDNVLREWLNAGVKQGPRMALLQGSDTHDPTKRRRRGTWLYLPEVSNDNIRQAFALHEASVHFGSEPPERPSFVVESIEFIGGHHDGLTFQFCERANALIGPPNAGKSLIVDALKLAFGIDSGIPEVEAVSAARIESCMPIGSSIEVRVGTPSGVVPIRWVSGGAQSTAPPFKPIVFGQTELTRRAIAAEPAISLLDIHCPEASRLKSSIRDGAEKVRLAFVGILGKARLSRELRVAVRNPHDGLVATKEELDKVAGTEAVAKLATGTSRVSVWREKTREYIKVWGEGLDTPVPQIPQVPQIEEPNAFSQFMPSAELETLISEYCDNARNLRDQATRDLLSKIDEAQVAFTKVQDDVDNQLAQAGFERGSEVEARLHDLRARFDELERKDRRASELEKEVCSDLALLRKEHSAVYEERLALTAQRREACSRVNRSMHTFFARIFPEGVTHHLDALIDDLKTGTRMQAATRQSLRDSLDRFRLLEDAVQQAQGNPHDGSNQARLVEEGLARKRDEDIAALACLWPGDSLQLYRKEKSPSPFNSLTEGLRALAIKEISFAASELPVITDQPEDAVPTRSVFESLVPTLREQRRMRQFIVVSHDANIVVSTDVERIWVLQANSDNSPHVGNLFDERVRSAAMEHLEGGEAAFRLRADRYDHFSASFKPAQRKSR